MIFLIISWSNFVHFIIFFSIYTVSHYIYLCLKKKFKRRGTRRQLPPRAWTSLRVWMDYCIQNVSPASDRDQTSVYHWLQELICRMWSCKLYYLMSNLLMCVRSGLVFHHSGCHKVCQSSFRNGISSANWQMYNRYSVNIVYTVKLGYWHQGADERHGNPTSR